MFVNMSRPCIKSKNIIHYINVVFVFDLRCVFVFQYLVFGTRCVFVFLWLEFDTRCMFVYLV